MKEKRRLRHTQRPGKERKLSPGVTSSPQAQSSSPGFSVRRVSSFQHTKKKTSLFLSLSFDWKWRWKLISFILFLSEKKRTKKKNWFKSFLWSQSKNSGKSDLIRLIAIDLTFYSHIGRSWVTKTGEFNQLMMTPTWKRKWKSRPKRPEWRGIAERICVTRMCGTVSHHSGSLRCNWVIISVTFRCPGY